MPATVCFAQNQRPASPTLQLGWDNTGTSGSLEIRNDFAQPIIFFTNGSGSPYMGILGNTHPGFVGIGTTTPNYKLDVQSAYYIEYLYSI